MTFKHPLIFRELVSYRGLALCSSLAATLCEHPRTGCASKLSEAASLGRWRCASEVLLSDLIILQTIPGGRVNIDSSLIKTDTGCISFMPRN